MERDKIKNEKNLLSVAFIRWKLIMNVLLQKGRKKNSRYSTSRKTKNQNLKFEHAAIRNTYKN